MKFSLTSRQTQEYLSQADEISVEYNDYKVIPTLIERYPNARINLRLPYEQTEIDWKEIDIDAKLAKGNFILGVCYTNEINEAVKRGIDFYHRAPLHSFQELRDLQAAGVSEVILGAPLFFQLETIKRYFPTLSVRAIPNVALLEGSITHNDGICGTWIRPEDLHLYEPYVGVVEFHDELSAERALFRIYKAGKWSSELNMVVKDLDHNAVNRMILPEMGETRINCGQKCMQNGSCQICKRTLNLANPDAITNYLAAMDHT